MRLRLLLPAAMFFLSQFAAGQVTPLDPHKTWKVLETEHFAIIYDEPDKALAQKFANEAERAAKFLEPELKTQTRHKVPLVVADITDSSNGSATAIPRAEIEIYPVLPSVFDPTSEYYDWAREVIQHEYTHIMNFEPVSGFMSVLRFVYGSIITPGGYLPRWYTEGLAVEMESRFTPVGRGRSHYYSGLIRALVDDGVWSTEGIDRINPTSIPTWPRGQRPYTYGHFLLHYLSEAPLNNAPAGENPYSLLDNRFGGRFPWFINGPANDYFDTNWSGLLDRMYRDVGDKARAQIKMLNDHGSKKGTPFAQSGYFNYGAQISPDHLKMAAIISDYNEYPSVRVWTRKTPNEPFVLSKDFPAAVTNEKDIHQISWRADNRYIVFDHSDTYRHYSTLNDLYELDTNNGDEKQLTEGLRAREATVMPDGSLVFVAATSTKTQLMHSDANGKNPTVLYRPVDGERVSSPRPFGRGVIYSHRDSRGHEWIESIGLDGKGLQKLTLARKTGEMHVMPVADPDSTDGFYYSASYNGVMNIYYSNPRKTEPVTNVVTYASSPTVDVTAHQIIYSRLTGSGFVLESAPLEHSKKVMAATPSLEDYPKAEEEPATQAKVLDEHSYHGVSYLFPQYWLPFFYFVPGGVIFDASMSGNDPLNHHQYSLDIGYDSRANQPYEEIAYTNGSLPFYIDAAFANDYVYFAGANITEHVTYGYLDTRHYLAPNNNKWVFGPEVIYRMTEIPGIADANISGSLVTQAGPGATLTYQNVATVKDYQISPESGESFSIGYDYYLPEWGNQGYPNVHGTASYYLSGRPLPNHHVISLKASAWVTPQQNSLLTGTQQAGGEVFGSIISPSLLVRGYPAGEFLGWTMYVANFEYRFPLAYPFHGPGTFPLFFNKVHGALVADAITLDGGFYNNTFNPSVLTRATLGTYYVGTGAEIRADTQVFYGIPITWRLGLYYGLTEKAWGGFNYVLSLGSVL